MSERDAVWRPDSSAVLGCALPHLGAARRALLRALVLGLGRGLTVEGAGRLAAAGEPVILAANHNNTIESLAVPVALQLLRGGRPAAWLIDWMYLRLPVAGWLIRLGDPIPVWRKSARWGLWERHRRAQRHRDPLAEALARLAAGGSIGVFPEGTRNRRADALLRGRGGLGRLVLASAAPVVPIGIHYPAAARLGRMPRIGRAVVRIGEPLPFAAERAAWRAASAAGDGAAGAAARRLGRAVVERVMAELAALSGKAAPAPPAHRPPRPLPGPVSRRRPLDPTRKPHPNPTEPRGAEA